MQGFSVILILLIGTTATLAARRVRPQAHSSTVESDVSRIIGGEEAEVGFAPHQISLQGEYDSHMCGGSILNEEWILTAAHCVDGFNPTYLRIITGTNEWKRPGAIYFPDAYHVHNGYDPYDPNTPNPFANDIALVHLNDTIEFDEYTQPAPLVTEPLQDGDELVLTGWGSTDMCGSAPDELHKITLQYISREKCLAGLSEGDDDMSGMLDVGHICTFTQVGEGSCHGDSGGPLVNANGELCGLVNWGKPCAKGKPDAHADVYHYHDWIRRTTNGKC